MDDQLVFITNQRSYEDLRNYQMEDISIGRFVDASKNTIYAYSDQDAIFGSKSSLVDMGLINYSHKYLFNTPYLREKYPLLSSDDPYSEYLMTTKKQDEVEKEKERIENQSGSSEYNREDHFAIGTVYLKIPPTQINITEESFNNRLQTLRAPGETMMTTGKTTTRVELDIAFVGLEDINNKLRPLLAQFKTTPFLPIENEYIKNILNPFNRAWTSLEEAKDVARKATLGEESNKAVEEMLKLASDKDTEHSVILDYIDKMKSDGLFDGSEDGTVDLIRQYITAPDTISIKDIRKEDYSQDEYGRERIDISRFVKNRMRIESEDYPDFVRRTSMRLSDLEDIQKKLDHINKRMEDLNIQSFGERFLDRQLACVLSQLALSVSADFPDTIQCKLVLYLFHYGPFSRDFLFVSGYNKNDPTSDITKCSMFIDWYARRFLSDSKNTTKPSLGRYAANSSMLFRYCKKIDAVDTTITYENLDDFVEIDEFIVNDGIYATGITFSLKNIIQFIPILSSARSTCQYLGSLNTDILVSFESTSKDKINELCRMVSTVRDISRKQNRITRTNFVSIKNDFLQFLGINFFFINDLNIDTVPGNPGLISASLSLSEYKPGLFGIYELHREGIVSKDDPKRAAEYILDKANAYGLDPVGNASLKEYYNIVMDKQDGWFRDNLNIIEGFMGGVGVSSSEDEELYLRIQQNSPRLSNAEAIWNETKAIGKTAGRSIIPGNAFSFIFEESQKFLAGEYGVFGANLPKRMESIKSDYRAYSREMRDSIGNPDLQDEFLGYRDTIASVASIIQRGKIVAMMNDPSLSDLGEFINANRTDEEIAKSKIYCYPDLDLPRYSDIPNGVHIKNTYRELGIPSHNGNAESSPQSMYDEVDPDFYFYNRSIWDDVDNSTDTYEELDSVFQLYKDIALSNKMYRETGAPDEKKLCDELSSREMYEEGEFVKSNQNRYFSSEERDEIEGKDITDIRVVDGDTFTGRIGNKTVTFRVAGYDSPEKLRSAYAMDNEVWAGTVQTKKNIDPKKAEKAEKLLLFHLSTSTNVRAYSSTGELDKYGRFIANVMISRDNGKTFENVSGIMIASREETGISEWKNYEDPLTNYYSEEFSKQHDVATKPMVLKDSAIDAVKPYKIIRSVLSSLAGGPGGYVDMAVSAAESNPIARSVRRIYSSSPDDVNRVAIEETKLLLGGFISTGEKLSGVAGLETESDITNNSGGRRFDRESEVHLKLLQQKVREAQKDDTLRMARAYPTFKLYFIEEDMPDWGMFDDYYSYSAVNSIEITKSRQEPADVAVINLINLQGTLDRSKFGLHDSRENYQTRKPTESIRMEDQETEYEQSLDEFILKPGTIIKIKMGYNSDPDILEDVFVGMISEVSGGDSMEVIAQGFGFELLNRTVQSHVSWTKVSDAYGVLDKVLENPSVQHFGKFEWLPEDSAENRNVYRRKIYDPVSGSFGEPAWWRSIRGIRHILSLREDQRNNNIFTPEHSLMYALSHGGVFNFVTHGKTVWDIFREMQRRNPGYITTVLPYDNRATIYFGPAESFYYYTGMRDRARKMNDDRYHEDAKMKDYSDDPNEKTKVSYMIDHGYTEVDDVELFGNVASYLNNYQMTDRDRGKILELKSALNRDWLYGIKRRILPKERLDIISFLDSVRGSLEKTDQSIDVDNGLRALSDIVKSDSESPITATTYTDSEGNDKIVFSLSDDGKLYYDKTGKIKTIKQVVEDFNSVRKVEWLSSDPSKKLVRKYHFKDSIHHIIANTIVASDTYMYNKVTVEYGSGSGFTGNFLSSGVPASSRIPVQIDDDIWPEKIKEKVVQERNATTPIVAWQYALGNLWEEARKMYHGHLTILGDPSVKPYDIVMIGDFFTDMFGPIEVEQVTHHFSHDTGFVTTIVPNLMCYVNNCFQMGLLPTPAVYMDKITNLVASATARLGGGSPIPLLNQPISNAVFWLSGLARGRREPISFSPLIYAGKPYIAGVEGMKATNLIEMIAGHPTRFILRQKRILDTIYHSWQNLRLYVYDRMTR